MESTFLMERNLSSMFLLFSYFFLKIFSSLFLIINIIILIFSKNYDNPNIISYFFLTYFLFFITFIIFSKCLKNTKNILKNFPLLNSHLFYYYIYFIIFYLFIFIYFILFILFYLFLNKFSMIES